MSPTSYRAAPPRGDGTQCNRGVMTCQPTPTRRWHSPVIRYPTDAWRLAWLAAALAAVVLTGLAWRFGAAATLALSLAAPSAGSWVDLSRETPAREDVAIDGPSGTLR